MSVNRDLLFETCFKTKSIKKGQKKSCFNSILIFELCNNNFIVFYHCLFQVPSSGDLCLTFEIVRDYVVGKIQPVAVRVYDYHTPGMYQVVYPRGALNFFFW